MIEMAQARTGRRWGSVFVFATVLFVCGLMLRAKAGSASASSTSTQALLPWRYGDTIPATVQSELARTFGPFRRLIILQSSDTTFLFAKRYFWASLNQQYGSRGLRLLVLLPDSTRGHHPTVSPLIPAGVRAATMMLDDHGAVLYANSSELGADQFRQLVQGAADSPASEPAFVVPDAPEEWTRGIQSATLSDGNRLILPQHFLQTVDAIVVFSALRPECALKQDKEAFLRLRDSLNSRSATRIVGLFPATYRAGAGRHFADSLGVDLVFSSQSVVPAFDNVTRPDDAGAPMVLSVTNGQVVVLRHIRHEESPT
jgi:hypothetical protein